MIELPTRLLEERGSRANCLLDSKTTSVVGRGRPGIKPVYGPLNVMRLLSKRGNASWLPGGSGNSVKSIFGPTILSTRPIKA